MKNMFVTVKVLSILAHCVIIKLQHRVLLEGMKDQFMKVSSIPAQCVIIKQQHRVI